MGVAADDQIYLRNCLCQNLVFGLFGILTGAAVGDTDNHIHIFLGSDLFYYGGGSLGGVLEFQDAGGGAGQRIYAEDTQNGNAHRALCDNHIILHAVCVKGIPQKLLLRRKALRLHGFPVDVA